MIETSVRRGAATRSSGTRLSILLLVIALPAGASEFWVDPTIGNDGWPGSEAQPWRTLTHSLATAEAGDTVRARAGTYGSEETFPLTLVDGVALIGAGAGSSVIVAPLDRDHFVMDGSPLGPTTRLEGFTLRGDYPGAGTVMVFHLGAAVVEPVITRNRIDAYGWSAISVRERPEFGGVFAARITDNDICGFSEVFANLRLGGPHTFAPVVEDNFFSCGDAGSFVVEASRSWHGTLAPVLRRNRFAGNFFITVVKVQTDQQVTVAPILDSNSGFFGFELCPPEAAAAGSLVGDIALTGDSLYGQAVRVQCTSPDGSGFEPGRSSMPPRPSGGGPTRQGDGLTEAPGGQGGPPGSGRVAAGRSLGASSFALSAKRSRLGSVSIDLASTLERWDGGVAIELVDSEASAVEIDLGTAAAPVRRDVALAGNRIRTADLRPGVFVTVEGTAPGSVSFRGNRIEATGWTSRGALIRAGDMSGDGVALECNEITAAGGEAVIVERGAAAVDLGGGGRSRGLNALIGQPLGLHASGGGAFSARHNWWGTAEANEIATRILGEVEYVPFLTAHPARDIAATLVAAVVDDAAPLGPSIGDTLEYTAVVRVPEGACGDGEVDFALALPDNVALVPGSVTSDRGTVISEQPIEVNLGWLGASETAMLRWQVSVEGGTRVVSQGTVRSREVEERLTDDPGEPGPADPTVVELVAAPSIPVGGGALAALAAGIAAAGALLLRRRRQRGEKSTT